MKRALIPVLAVAVSAQCTPLPSDPLQLLVVEVTTTGSAPDLAGYIATVDGAQAQAVAADGTITFTGLAAGDHVVELSGLPGNCHVDGNPRTVSLTPNGVAEMSFAVICVATGGLIVQATTIGVDLDDDGFTVTVNGDPELAQAVGPTGSVVFEDLAAGQHSVALTDYADNCAVVGDNPRAATIVEDGFALVQFAVVCSTAGPGTPGTGSLLVVATTTGSSLDPDGYWATVDGDEEQRKAVGPIGSVLFEGLAVGEHIVALTGVAANCSPEPSLQSVTVLDGGITQASFALTCVGDGGLVVQATTTGSDVDVDGYTVSVDGDAALIQAVGPNSSVAFADLEPGEHTLLLSGVATNCSVADPNPRTVTIAADATVQTTFTVSCMAGPPSPGALEVITNTTGTDIDPDGYRATVDGNDAGSMTVGSNGSVLFEGLPAGEHTVLLSGVATNCSVADPNPRTVTVAADAAVQTTFTVSCEASDPPPHVGTLRVEVTTAGCEPGTAAYKVKVDGEIVGTVATNGAATFEDLAVGEHTVRLSGVAGDCMVQGHNPETVSIEEGAVTLVAFEVVCRDD